MQPEQKVEPERVNNFGAPIFSIESEQAKSAAKERSIAPKEKPSVSIDKIQPKKGSLFRRTDQMIAQATSLYRNFTLWPSDPSYDNPITQIFH